MADQQVHEKRAKRESNHHANKGKFHQQTLRRILRNVSIAHVLFGCCAFIAAIALGPLTTYPDLDRKATIWIVVGFVVLAIGAIGLGINAYLKRNELTEEEKNSEYREQTNITLSTLRENLHTVTSRLDKTYSRFDAIDARLMGRKLTKDQVAFVAKHLMGAGAVFNACIRYSHFARDGAQYAMSLADPLTLSGWKIVDTDFKSHQVFPLEFCLHPEDWKNIPPQVKTLISALVACGAVAPDTKVTENSGLERGTLGIYVGTAP